MLAPVFNIDTADFTNDPYPIYARMQAEGGICHVPQLGATLLTLRDDIYVCEKNVAVFSSVQPHGLMTRLMGENMMRKDGDAHALERRQVFQSLSPRTAAGHWQQIFSQIVSRVLDELERQESGDLVAAYAMRVSAEALKCITGLVGVDWREIDAWSQAMIDGISNFGGDREIETRCITATAAIDAAVLHRLAESQDDENDWCMIAVMQRNGMAPENICHNIKLAISGGQNEPRDAIAGVIHALLAHRAQYLKITNGEASFLQAFEEYGRWISPIGMSPRRIAVAHTYAGIDFEPESRAFLMFGAANRDASVFENPEVFDISRNNAKNIVFGSGPHFCAGAHVARMLVAGIAVPAVFARLEDLRLEEEVHYRGWAFRGPVSLKVRWKAVA